MGRSEGTTPRVRQRRERGFHLLVDWPCKAIVPPARSGRLCPQIALKDYADRPCLPTVPPRYAARQRRPPRRADRWRRSTAVADRADRPRTKCFAQTASDVTSSFLNTAGSYEGMHLA